MVKHTQTILWQQPTNFFSVFDHFVEACNVVKKETLAQVFFCKFCEIFKNTFLNRTPLVAAFVSFHVNIFDPIN